jgi:uncharacterized protein
MTHSQTYRFHVQGMHCSGCTIFIESELGNQPGVRTVRADIDTKTVDVMGDFGGKTPQAIVDMLTLPIKEKGYALSLEEALPERKWSEFTVAVPIALGFILLFVLLQKAGIVNLISGRDVTLGTAFVIGIVASLSTCMAVVGGLLLSMSATFAKEGDKTRPQIFFHLGRLIAFFVLGGVIGTLGSAFALNATATFIVSLIIGLVVLVLGVNLLDVFPWFRRLQPSMPSYIATRAHGVSRMNHSLTPFLVGIATFFLPCGFTQSMQFYTLSTGSFFAGAMTMLAFALGTFPVLALISFSSFSIKNSSKAGVFFKAAGLIVILFALFNIVNSLAAIGIIEPLFNF